MKLEDLLVWTMIVGIGWLLGFWAYLLVQYWETLGQIFS